MKGNIKMSMPHEPHIGEYIPRAICLRLRHLHHAKMMSKDTMVEKFSINRVVIDSILEIKEAKGTNASIVIGTTLYREFQYFAYRNNQTVKFMAEKAVREYLRSQGVI